ncbi:exonuclease 1 [Leptopilina boulardi]|uniref:exonuclease 1 n=1 Tax=Leptopilina boulardi TaxID=63433 RepID=UPI0021F60A15|nr:exonuclease 1 [Leptopilina boulardi]
MGITGLIPFLSKASKKCNISEFSGGTAAIDAYCWLHKGAFSCADKLIMGQSSDAYVKYCMKLVHMLIAANVKPILVFDGRHLPAKADTESKRREQRDSNKRRAAELMRMGKHYEGKNLLRRSLDISHEMALEVIKQCQAENVDCIVAPYEADAQLAYLNISGIADVVITEDSDLTLFGCTKIFFKMDINGNGLLVEQDRIHLAMGVRAEHFDMDKFRHMCILSGCDYLPSLPGIGLSKACKFILKNTDCDIYNALSRIASYLNMKSLVVTKEYRDGFIRAFVTFKHQMVYCPMKRQQVRLYPPPPHVTDEQLRHAGIEVDEDLALQLALGNYDPFKLKKLHDYNPDDLSKKIQRTNSWTDRSIVKHESIWSRNFKKREITSPKQKTLKPFIHETAGQVMMYKTTIMEKSTPKKRSFDDVDEDIDYIAMYSQESKKKSEITEAKPVKKEEQEEDDKMTSPVLSRRTRNPFAKGADGESPSLLTRTRRRTRLNIFTPTVIDSTVVEESKFFAKSSSSEINENEFKYTEKITLCNDSEILNQIKNEGKENINENKIFSICKDEEEEEEEKETEFLKKNSKDIQQLKMNDGEDNLSENFSMENQQFSKSSEDDSCQENTLDKSIGISNIKITADFDSELEENSSKCLEATEGSLFMDTGELLNNLESQRSQSPDSELEYSVEASSIETIRTGLFQWSNTKTLGAKKLTSQHKQVPNKRKSRTSSGARKSTVSQGQQSRLNMFGFEKRSSLKH